MSFEELLVTLNEKRISLKLEDQKVSVFDPENNLEDVLIAELRKYKGQLKSWLSEGSGYTESDFPYSKLTSAQIASIEKAHPGLERLYIATPMQSGLLYHGLLESEGSLYISQWYCDLVGEVDVDVLQSAWETVISRHNILRTCFVALDTEQIHQLVAKEVALPFVSEDLRGLTAAEQQQKLTSIRELEKGQGFDFAVPPLMRIHLCRLADDSYHFLWTRHHALLDGWSSSIIFGEVIECYRSLLNRSALELQTPADYEDYIGWLYHQNGAEARDFWTEALNGFREPTQLRISKKTPPETAAGVDNVKILFDEKVTAKLEALAQASKCTMSAVFQAAWSYLLHRYSAEDQVVFGSTVSGRPAELSGVERMMGLFINTIPIRVQIRADQSLGELLSDLQTKIVGYNKFGYLSLTDIQRTTGVENGTPLFHTLLGFESFSSNNEISSQASDLSDGFSVKNVNAHNQSNYDLVLLGSLQNQRLSFGLNYQCKLYDAVQMQRLAEQMQQVLTEMAAGGLALRLSDIDLLGKDLQQEILVDWNATDTGHDSEVCLHQLFERQVVACANRVALISGAHSLTFQALNERANRLAHFLVDSGVRPDSFVGLYLDRSIDMMVALLAVLKAGGAYVPLDVGQPIDRLMSVLDDANPKVVLTQVSNRANLLNAECAVVCLDAPEFRDQLQSHSVENLDTAALGVTSNHLAYMIYTSGSTGLPKGVLINHGSVVNFLSFAKDAFLSGHVDGAVVSSPITFDATVQSLYVALIGGKYVDLLPEERVPIESLANRMFETDQSLLFKITPAHLRALTKLDIIPNESARHVIVVAGELLTHDTIAPWVTHYLPNSTFINEYGPTEATVGSSVFPIDRRALKKYGHAIPIGKPIANTKYYVLDGDLRPQPIGLEGELYIAGAGVARSYHNRDELTSAKFVTSPLSTASNDILYRTGDVVRWLDDGNLEFIGRTDNQVKIRGFRVELGEIESKIETCDGVKSAVVALLDDDQRLAAFVVHEEKFDEDEVLKNARQSMLIESFKNRLAAQLPDFMLPASFTFVEEMPLNPSGKVDRKALSQLDATIQSSVDYEAPRSEIEKQLCQLWQEVLKVNRVGVNDNFFALGGDSIVSIQLVSRAKSMGLVFSVRALTEFPTVAELAVNVNRGTAVAAPQGEVSGRIPMLPIQLQFFERNYTLPDHYNQSVFLETSEGFDETALSTLVEAILRRHDALRTRFDLQKVSAEQLPFDPNMLTQCVSSRDFSHMDDAARLVESKNTYHRAHASLDIQTGAIFKAVFFDYGQGTGRLLLVAHHLVVDGVSWRILIRDLESGWRQWSQEQPIRLAAKTSSIQQWGQALHQYAYSAAIEKERAYWLSQLSIEVAPITKRIESSANGVRENQLARFSLDESRTQSLLGACNEAYRTQVNELFLTGLLMAYARWTDGHSVMINLEGHGRDDIFEKLDLSDTVGWFTKIYPLILSSNDSLNDVGELIKSVKDQHRQVPNSGVGFGVLKNIKKDRDLLELYEQQEGAAIKFNYLGQFDNTISKKGVFQPVTDGGKLTGSSVAEENSETNDAMLITGEFVDDRLHFIVSLSGEFTGVGHFASLFEQSLIDIVVCCEEANAQSALLTTSKAVIGKSDELRDKGISV